MANHDNTSEVKQPADYVKRSERVPKYQETDIAFYAGIFIGTLFGIGISWAWW